ncbi:uncharacterized protein BYT42DRAFT_564301 [Radiomyces spectabilis]|uniref:uncharacterized protein n=1 Tax=Radiomyces spectabilis TaxID=64574 RepID=UPI00221E7002|nr:uncharacterized protein BYT42DRAFT_564301 [Radiomyces spectabilis]KAI8384987.1 hypothetical protein BYT42DRAFT_564301 [Radiomyces spectabilis]
MSNSTVDELEKYLADLPRLNSCSASRSVPRSSGRPTSLRSTTGLRGPRLPQTITASNTHADKEIPVRHSSETPPTAPVQSSPVKTTEKKPINTTDTTLQNKALPKLPKEVADTHDEIPKKIPPTTPVPAPKKHSPPPALPATSSSPCESPLVYPFMRTACAGCDKPISGMAITAAGSKWHADCFKCRHCGQDLEHIAFYEKDGQPYCALDYHELFSTRCDYCNTPIEEKSISALGKHYHVGHFFCRECGKPFDESSAYMVHEGHPYCEKDYLNKYGHKCMGCGEYIMGEFLGALDGDWHKECFVCASCGKAFTSATFYVRNNKPFCEEHFQQVSKSEAVKTCHGCGELIDGREVTAFGKHYHLNHFQCALCSKLLSPKISAMWKQSSSGELICNMCCRKISGK